MFCSKIINCKEFVEAIKQNISKQTRKFIDEFKETPCIALIRVKGDAASEIYVNNKIKACASVGIQSLLFEFEIDVSQNALENKILELNKDKSVHGILLQLPLPKHLNEFYLTNLIDPLKDVDGLTVKNQGNLLAGNDGLFPCTPSGIVTLLKHIHNDLSGMHAVVVGRSNIVGKPMAQLLLRENCSISVVHSKTRNICEITKSADILVAAVGKPKFIGSDWVKTGSTIIDVGINRIDIDGKTKIVGDVDLDAVVNKVAYITPVPGGVGPITVSFLLKNTLKAVYMQKKHLEA